MVTLESSKLFSSLPAPDLKMLRAVTEERNYAAGNRIFDEGDPGDGVYVVKTGAVQISVTVAGGQHQKLSLVLPGDVFGELSVLDSCPRSASATAETDTFVYFVPREHMVGLLQRLPELSMTLVQEISGRLREFNRQYIHKLLQAERMALVGRFASSIVHDLKNPLTIISIAADRACTESATPEVRKTSLNRIGTQVERITDLVNDILEFTRGGLTPLPLAQMDYAEFVKSLVEELDEEIRPKSVAIRYTNPPPALKVSINPQRLMRVFQNLVSNALDVMPGGGQITLRFETTDQEVITEIEDSGPGIALEIMDQLFEAFVTQGKPRGTGLGLCISKRIIEEHGGKMSAHNRPEGGAVFRFTLPMQPRAEAALRH